ncbi:cupredoxin family copper-binding protein [Methanosarcina hadiensis]|uniref:cupredoxin domain-containing protein n=1 Tax=Methanosarcina hadiensis TaxID=3078083 RepID=UPI0039776F7F
MRKEIIIFLVILGVFFAVGCVDDEDSDESEPSVPVEEVDNGVAAGAEETGTGTGSDIVKVEIRNYRYIPQNITVKVGQTVMWTNNDTVLHDVVGSGIESDYLQKGEKFTYTFEEEGSYQYICSIHPWMEGEVIVEA